MMMREYETIFIMRPDLGDEARDAVLTRARGVVEGQGGVILRDLPWGKRKMAYEIDGHLKGQYHYLQYLGTSGLTQELERNLRMLDAVLKYLTVKLDERVEADERQAVVQAEIAAEAARPEKAPVERKPVVKAAEDDAAESDGDDSADGEDATEASETADAE